MKPAFALSFSDTGISLHHHSDGDWFCVGEVSLDSPDLTDQIRALRDQGFALENDLSCKVIIPQDQVRFLSEPFADLPTEECLQKAQRALVDETPYSLDELVFSSTTDDSTAYVAAVTKQTLDEAREFAASHGFIPVEFSAATDGQDYPKEPLFSEIEPDSPQPVTTTTTKEPPKDQDAPAVHAIADAVAPDVFRSASDHVAASEPKPSAASNTQSYAIFAAAIVVAGALGIWALTGSEQADETGTETALIQDVTKPSEPPVTDQASEPEVDAVEEEVALDEPSLSATIEESPPDVSATDAAILEALNVAPTVVEDVARETEEPPAQRGLEITSPVELKVPFVEPTEALYLTSVDNSNLSQDAIAQPPVQGFATDLPFDRIALPSPDASLFDLDERGLVTPTPEGTQNPDGIVVFEGRPSKAPPSAPVRFEQEPTLEETDDRLAGLRPKSRPNDLNERFERQQLGGRSREELSGLRPKVRPSSLEESPEIEETQVALAPMSVPIPKSRPAGLVRSAGTQTASLGSTAAISQDEAGSFQPKSVAPKIPSSASVARQATIDNALNLRKLNLIGVYGTPANRRALVRLPSGRYKKLKVGDRLDGGKVIAISDNELRYQKKGRNLTLKMPRG